MLILSRRKLQQIRIPQFGITLKVLFIKKNSVRLGIDAPRDVHIIRAELESTNKYVVDSTGEHPAAPSEYSTLESIDRPTEFQECLESAYLAIHLAQNQMRQHLYAHAEQALDDALDCLEKLESVVQQSPGVDTLVPAVHETTVREAGTPYQCRPRPVNPDAGSCQNRPLRDEQDSVESIPHLQKPKTLPILAFDQKYSSHPPIASYTIA